MNYMIYFCYMLPVIVKNRIKVKKTTAKTDQTMWKSLSYTIICTGQYQSSSCLVATWACDTVMWHWSADTLFWHPSVVVNMDVHYQVKHRLQAPTFLKVWHFILVSLWLERLYGHVITQISRMDGSNSVRKARACNSAINRKVIISVQIREWFKRGYLLPVE